MIEPLTQDQIDDIVRWTAETARGGAANPSFVFDLPVTSAQAARTTKSDGWRESGAVVDVPDGRSQLVRWHRLMRRSRFGSAAVE